MGDNIYTICQSGQSGPRFMLSASCDPFDPSNPQCFVRLQDDPFRKCYFCCQHENVSLQTCSDIRSQHVLPRYPTGWTQKQISSSLCYEKGYINDGYPLKVFKDNDRRPVNYKGDIFSVDSCRTLCQYYGQCQWWNYDPTGKNCWLKKGAGSPRRESQFMSMYTG